MEKFQREQDWIRKTVKKADINIIVENIDSTMIDYIHFNSSSQSGNLGVTFKNGESYIYGNVRIKSILNVLASSSIGEGFNTYIKGSYTYKSVGNCNGESPLIKNKMI